MFDNKLHFLVLFAFLSLVPIGLQAQTEVAGEVLGIWDIEGSPYIVIEDILIPNDEQLEIQPGVEIRFNANNCLYVNGMILAEGNEENEILFTNNDDDDQITWRGIRCYESDEGSIISHAIIENAFPDSVLRYNKGGGIYTDQLSFLTLQNSTIRNCRADMGGGMCMYGINVSVSNCIFENNTARYGGGLDISYFGEQGWFHISNNVFRNNHATDSRGAISIDASSSYVNISGNRFENNSAESGGGGLYIWRCWGGVIRDNVFVENRSVNNATLVIGTHGEVLIAGNQFINNSEPAVIYARSGQVTSYANTICQHTLQVADLISVGENCAFESYNDVIFDNSIENEGAVLYLSETSRGKIRNAVIFGNELPDDQPVISYGDYTEIDIRFSDIQGGWDGEGNINEDPLFANPDELDFQLTENSPCIDTGEPSGVYNDRDGSRNDMGIFGGVSVFPDKSHFDFGLQAVDIPEVINWKWYNFSGDEARFLDAFIDENVFTIEPPDLEIEPFATSIVEITYTAEGVGEDESGIELTYLVGDIERIVEIPLNGAGVTGQRGEIAGEWTVDESPYYIIENCVIIQGEELLIEPGVEVRFLNQSILTINGTLTAEGEEGDSIRFTNGNEDRSEWGQGLRFEGEPSECSLAYVIVENLIVPDVEGNNFPGAARFHGGDYIIENSSFRNCVGRVGGISVFGSNFEIRNSEIIGNRGRTNVGGISISYGVKIIDCVIAGNTCTEGELPVGGIYLYGSSQEEVEDSLVVTGCKIYGNEGSGMFLGPENCRYHIAYNEVYSNTGQGLWFFSMFGCPVLAVDHMTVYGNGEYGACGEGDPEIPEITNSILWGHIGADFHEGGFWDNIIDMAFSCFETFEGWWEFNGEEIIREEPRFFDPEGLINGTPDFRLRADSPCIGTGQDGTDMGAHPFEGEEEEFNIELVEGWSSLGLRILPETVDIRELFAELVEDDNLLMLKNDDGEFYAPQWDFCGIDHFEYFRGYQIKLNGDTEFTVRGVQVVVDEPIDLEEDWNIISYYHSEQIDVREAFASIEDQLILVKNHSGQFWIPEFGGGFVMQPNQGYWVKVTQDIRFAYPVEGEEENQIREINDWDRWENLISAYQIDNTHSTMSIVVKYSQLADSGHIIAKDRDGNVFGVGQCMPDHCKVVLYGDDSTTPDRDGFTEKSLIELWYSNPNGKIYSVEPSTGELHYQTNGFDIIDASIQGFVEIPNEYCLLPAYPNPFNANVRISFGLPENGWIGLTVFDLNGRQIETIANASFDAGYHSLTWSTGDKPAGVYFVRLEAGDFVGTQKVVLVR